MKATGIHEYTRKCRVEGALLARIVFLCVLFAFMIFVTVLFSFVLSSIPFFIIFSVLSVSVFMVIKPLFSEMRDYEIVDGSFRIYKVYGAAISKKVFECEMRDMTEVAPYQIDMKITDVDKIYDFLSDSRSKDAFYAVYEKNGLRGAVIFDGDEKFSCAAAFYFRRAFSRF